MRTFFSLLITTLALMSCGSTIGLQTTTKAARVVSQSGDQHIKLVPIDELHTAFLQTGASCDFNHTVVDVQGTVVAYGLTKEGVYTITLEQNGQGALCTFDEAVASEFGTDGTVFANTTLVIRGQCQSTGLLANQPFAIHGCKIVSQ
ncbi:MAG: hypothetical protein QGI78_06320 [Phycisphaerales bacterium]|nr:hypothetical protein [Phycisphaerales bacterium]